jgi:hypothetical protein
MADNVKVTTKGNILTIEVDLSKDFGMSKSGKTKVIATTGGTMAIGDGVLVNLNVNQK